MFLTRQTGYGDTFNSKVYVDLKMACLLTIDLVLCFVNNSSALVATWPSNDNAYKMTSTTVNRRERIIQGVLNRNMDNSGITTASVNKEKLNLDGCTKNHISPDCKKLNSFC